VLAVTHLDREPDRGDVAVALQVFDAVDIGFGLGDRGGDLGQFAQVNAVMAEYFASPYPARSTVQVSALPRGAVFEVDAVMVRG
jgi:enamine deaminase RidA (YjgF/YER057c/UK114 family)